MPISLKQLNQKVTNKGWHIVRVPKTAKKDENLDRIDIFNKHVLLANINMKKSWDISIHNNQVNPLLNDLLAFAKEPINNRFGMYQIEIEITDFDANVIKKMQQISEKPNQKVNWTKDEIFAIHHVQRQLANAKRQEI